MSDTAAELAVFLRAWAESELRGYCPLYDVLARRLADDDAMLERYVAAAPRDRLVGVLLFAAVKYLVSRDAESPLARIYAGGEGDAWPAFRAVLATRQDELVALLETRRIQTNEVGRAAVLLPALGLVERRLGGPLALVELGPSAGLNLFLDRFAYVYDDGRRAGDRDSPVEVRSALRGPLRPPVPAAMPAVASRCGIDLAPVDVTDDEQCRWLEACLWPGTPGRSERLRAAIALARRTPPRLLAGNVVERLPGVLAEVPVDRIPCLVSTWMLAYLSEEERGAVRALVDAVGRTRPLAVVTAEFPGVSPWIGRAPRPAAIEEARMATLVGLAVWRDGTLDARPLCWTHSHGQWLDWLDGESAA